MMRFQDYITESVNDKGIFKAVFMAGSPGCFDGETLVDTNNGFKKISDIEVGDQVLTFDEETGDEVYKPVLELFKYDVTDDDILEIEFENGETVICTENHEFYVNGEWVKAKDL